MCFDENDSLQSTYSCVQCANDRNCNCITYYYITTGGGGAELATGEPLSRSYAPYKQIAYHINEHCTVEIYDDHAVLWITMPDGKVFDAVTIQSKLIYGSDVIK